MIYNPFYWYEHLLDLQYEALDHGYDDYHEYLQSLAAEKENYEYDVYNEERL